MFRPGKAGILPASVRGSSGLLKERRTMKHTTPNGRASKGSALLVTVGYLAAMTIFASTFLSFLNRTVSNQHRTELRQMCLNIAEAGVDKALAELRIHRSDYRGERDTPLGKGRFSVEVKPGNQRGEYSIVSTARVVHRKVALSRARINADVVFSSDGAVRELRWSEVKRW